MTTQHSIAYVNSRLRIFTKCKLLISQCHNVELPVLFYNGLVLAREESKASVNFLMQKIQRNKLTIFCLSVFRIDKSIMPVATESHAVVSGASFIT